jgi:midasin
LIICTDIHRFSFVVHAQTFLTLLSGATAPALEALLSCHILKGLRASDLCRVPPEPPGAPGTHVLFEQYWVEAGTAPLPDPDVPDEFVLTPSVRRHLATLARAVLLRKHPILLQARLRVHAVISSIGQCRCPLSGNRDLR